MFTESIGQQVFDHMKPNSVSNTNAYDSKYRNADDIRNYVNNNEASYKSMKGSMHSVDHVVVSACNRLLTFYFSL